MTATQLQLKATKNWSNPVEGFRAQPAGYMIDRSNLSETTRI